METTQLGWYDNAQKPVLTINSGDTVVMETMMHFHDRLVPGGPTLDELLKVRQEFPGRGAHTLTGPIYVEGAEPGDALKVKINKIVPRSYGVNMNYPGLLGQFPKEFPEGRMRFVYLDWDKKEAEFLPGVFIPLRPFPGVLGVARAEPGRYSTVPPGRYAGNLDIRELTAGTSLYVPVFVKGALIWMGDSHCLQGNGEVNLEAIECAYKEIEIQPIVHKDMKLEWPRAETKTHWIFMGFDEDLTEAMKIAVRNTIDWLSAQKMAPMNRYEAYSLTSVVGDCRVTQMVDIRKGVHCMIAKDIFAKSRPASK
jgi:acetamidase/formamidase